MDAPPELNPYAAPRAERYVGSTEIPPLATKARVARWLLLLNIPALVLNLIWATLMATHVLTPNPRDFTSVATMFAAGIGCEALVLLFGAAVTFLVWFHAAYERATAGVADARFTARAAVGWWFVPFANLWLPFDALRHLWQLSRGGTEWRGVSPPLRLTLFWLVFCVWIGGACASFALVLSPSSRTVGQTLSYVGSCLSIVAALLAARIVREITALQRERLGQD